MDFKGDIHSNGAPKSGQDNLLKKDTMATPEARSFDIKVGNPMDKLDAKKEDPSFISGLSVGQIGSQCQGSLGEKGFGQISNTDMFGFPQQGMNTTANMNVGLAPIQSTKPPTMAESQKTSILHANEPPKPFLAPSKPSDTSTHNILDKPAGQAMHTHSPSQAEQSPSELLGYQGGLHKDATSDEGSNEAIQQKRKKCETSEEACGLLESLRSPEKTQSKSSNQEDDGDGETWKSEIREWGGGRIQAKKSKSRMKLPEEWANLPNTGSPSLPPDPNTAMDIDKEMLDPDTHEAKDPPSTLVEQESSLPSFSTMHQSAIPATISQANTILLSNSPDLSKSNQVLTPNLTSGHETTAHTISSPHADTKTFQNNSSVSDPSSSGPSSTVVSQNSADPASLTSQTKHQDPPLAKSHQVKEETIAKEKTEKIDASPKTDILDTLVKADKPENTEKMDNQKVDNRQAEKQDSQTEKNGKVEKVGNVEETKKEVKEEKKNGSEKVDKTVKNEKNVKAAKETSKPTAANGTKDLISPDKVKSNKQNSAKPSSHSTGENAGALNSSSTNKKGPAAKKTSPTGTKKPPGITSSHDAKTSENSTPTQRKPPVPKFNGASAPKGSSGTKTSSSSAKPLKKTPANAASTPATDGTSAPRPSRITKPPVPKQVPLPKKPPVPRAPRSARVPNTSLPDLKNVSSKIGSTDNMKYQPGGGKVQIVHKKLDFSHITSRCGSKDNIKHVPGGGNVQILTKKVDLSKVTSKCGSKDNINHKPGGGNTKLESQKSKSKTGSMDSVGQEPGGDHAEVVGVQQKSEGSPPAPANPPIQTNGEMKEKGVNESSPVPPPAPSEGQGVWNSQSQAKHIPAIN
ncbi:microtubule-associated protein tau isoform X2 [Hemibagrus wyckioides]|uniref:microtubule-associated protein tau isoform X2 n=1 Tax=Hemibagrus wyckioides TaxID=337641 RepID=UPI00266CF847|nr:microtubule-associated protein tau isoform X2 [Hemibagrus wyckioides]